MDSGVDPNLPSISGKEKAILFHVSKVKDPAGEAQTLEEMELELEFCGLRETESNSSPKKAKKNSWYVLEQTSNGPKISEIFTNIPQYEAESKDHWLDSTGCAIVGSSLYVIGGSINSVASCESYPYRLPMSNLIHCLDLNNQVDGWKTSAIPFNFSEIPVLVGNSICILSKNSKIQRVGIESNGECGLVYETTEQVAYSFKPPPGCAWCRDTCYLSFEGRDGARGLVFPVMEQETKENRVYLHDPSQNSWKQLHDYSALTAKRLYNKSDYAVLNGILYLLDYFHKEETSATTLSAYDLNNGRKIFKKTLPKSVSRCEGAMLVPISDSMLCLLWHDPYGGHWKLRYAKISVSVDPPTVRVVDETQFSIEGSNILDYLPFDLDCYRDQIKEMSVATSNKQVVLELYWKRCCRYLIEENRRLREKVEKLKELQYPQIGLNMDVAPLAPMLAKEKSILIHVSRVADPAKSHVYEALELKFHNSKRDRFHNDSGPNLPKTDSWFIIKHTDVGPQMFEMFRDVLEDQPNSYCTGSSSAIVDNSLYVIGGRCNFSYGANYFSNEVRCLDFHNPAQGWKTSKIPFYFSKGSVEVVDNFMYILPRSPFNIKKIRNAVESDGEMPRDCDLSAYPWGLIYDTIQQEARPLEIPQGYENQKAFGFRLEGRGVVVPLGKCTWARDEVYLHDPRRNSWELLDTYFDLPLGVTNNYVVSNGTLFLFQCYAETSYLYAYEYDASSVDWLELLFRIELPQFDRLDFSCHFSVVEVADFTFCILGHEQGPSLNKGPLFYAKILVSLDPHPTVSILEETCFHMDGIEILNCLPFDSSLYPNLFKENPLPSSSREAEAAEKSYTACNIESRTEKELYWKQCFEKLVGDNRKLQKDMQELKGAKDVFQQC